MLLQVYPFKAACLNSPHKPHAFASLLVETTEPLVIVVTPRIVVFLSPKVKSLLIVAPAASCAIVG